MGYSTSFRGDLVFTTEATASQLAYLSTILGEDCREHPEWNARNLYHVDLALTKDFTGLRWDGGEKTYGMVELVNLVIRLMRSRWPEFGLRGRMDAQGEDIEDLWALVADESGARKIEMELRGRKVECPHCEQTFVLDAEKVEVST